MDHDSKPFELPGPPSQRAPDVRAAYRELTRQGLEVLGEQISTCDSYRSNESGHLAWDVTFGIRAASLAWQATRDPVHLEQLAEWAQVLIERTDQKLEAPDWRGETRPIWSAGRRYSAGKICVGHHGDLPIYLQASGRSVTIDKPSQNTAIIHLERDDGSRWSSPEASLLPGSENYLPDVLAQRSGSNAVLMRGLPAAIPLTALRTGTFKLPSQSAAHFVHTSLISRALITAAETLEVAPKFPTPVSPDELYGAAEIALTAHDQDIRFKAGKPWYITPLDFPGKRLGLALPHNHISDAATAFIILGRRKQVVELEQFGVALTSTFRQEIEMYVRNELRHPWHYYPIDSEMRTGINRTTPIDERIVPPVPRAEDSSHATTRVRALVEWKHLAPSLISDQSMNQVALAFRRSYMTRTENIPTLRWLPGDNKDAARRGYADTYSGAWSALSPWDSTIKRRINSMGFRHPPKAVFGATILSAAEILALNSEIVLGSPLSRAD